MIKITKVNEELTKDVVILYGQEWKVYGPYVSKEDGRKRVVLYNGKSRMTRQYAKILLEIQLKRKLKDDETVDHKDEDKTNDSIDNLQILSKSKNSSKSALKLSELPIVNCVWCNIEFKLTRDQMKRPNGPFCSKICSGTFGANLQNGKCSNMKNIVPERTYYR